MANDQQNVNSAAPATNDVDARRAGLKSLIILGKERGYLTYAEINDHLPDDIQDSEQIDGIISMINDMGIQVYEEAPDAEALLMSDASPSATDEDAVEEAEQALSTVDSEFGRTTDPVRMYMREMGTVDLLTREGEIEIAKRIEDGLKHMVQAIAACPTTITELLAMIDKVETGELRVDEVVDGLVETTESEEAHSAAEEDITHDTVSDDDSDSGDEDDDEDDDGAKAAAISAAALEELKQQVLQRFAVIREAFRKQQEVLKKHGSQHNDYKSQQEQILNELMAFRFSAKQVEGLCDQVRNIVEEVRKHERAISAELRRAGVRPGQMSIIEPSLEDVFISCMKA